jgi:TPR repeat protein
LGLAYAKGEGVLVNLDEAVKWWRKAAEQGEEVAQYQLGLAYSKGEGVSRDDEKAYFWMLLASSGGDPERAKARDAIAEKLDVSALGRARHKASRWKPQTRYRAAESDLNQQ